MAPPTHRAEQSAKTGFLDQLELLKKATADADFGKPPVDTFARRCKCLMKHIERLHQMPGDTVLAARAAQTSMNQTANCWADLRHYAGRLLSYHLGIRYMITAAETFPRLFENYEVKFVMSSQPDDNPIDNKSSVTADKILRTMLPTAAEASDHSKLVEETRSLDMDKAIQDIIQDKNFHPLVHAELLVLQSLEQDGLTHPSDFFNSWKYIGSSKPTCKLCHFYFAAHNGGFQVRPTHENLYINWKPPDVFQRDGEAAIKARKTMLDTIVHPIRAEALRILKEKAPRGKQHDSSTGMTLPALARGSQGAAAGPFAMEEDDMETSFGDADDSALDLCSREILAKVEYRLRSYRLFIHVGYE